MCDGKTDATPAIRQALDELQPNSGTLQLPDNGTCLLQPAVVVPSNITIDGRNATLAPLSAGFALLGLKGERIRLRNLKVDGRNNVVQAVVVRTGFDDVELRDVTITNVAQPTDPSTPGYADNRLQVAAGMTVEGDGKGLRLHKVTVSGVRATNTGATPTGANVPTPVARGIWVRPGRGERSSTDIEIANSSFSDVTPKDDGDCIVIQGHTPNEPPDVSLVVRANSFTRCAKRAIKVQLPGADISANRIDNPYDRDNPYMTLPPSQDSFDMYAGISVYASNVTVKNNQLTGRGSFYNGIEVGVCVEPPRPPLVLNNAVIEGNTVEMGATSRLGISSSIRLFSPLEGGAIVENSLANATWGIRVDQLTTNTRIEDNTFRNVKEEVHNGSCFKERAAVAP